MIIKDASSVEWLRIKGYCEERVSELREANDNDLGEIETAKTRGMIAFAREILDLDKADQQIETYSEDYSG